MPYNKLSLNTTKQRRRRVVKKMRTTIVILCLNKKEQRKSKSIRRRVKIEYNVWYNLMNVVALLSVIERIVCTSDFEVEPSPKNAYLDAHKGL